MNGLGLCIKLNSYVADMFYAWLFSHNAEIPIDIELLKTKFSYIHIPWCLIGAPGIQIKIEHILKNH